MTIEVIMSRYRFLSYLAVLFLAVGFFTRSALLIYSYPLVDNSIAEICSLYLVGMLYDVVSYFYYIIPFVIYLFIVPSRIFQLRIHKLFLLLLWFGVVYGVLFGAVSEWFFWEEFGKRFNFIAVDYLVYTHEVITNIQESYPIPTILAIISILTIAIFYTISRWSGGVWSILDDSSTYRQRLPLLLLLLIIPAVSFYALEKQHLSTTISANRYNQELAKNGLYSLFSAFRNNELDYYEFYKTDDDIEVLKRYRQLVEYSDGKFISTDLNNTLREIVAKGKEHRYNVMLVMIESLSASYMGIYGDSANLTPNIDAISRRSLTFSNMFATGTRTVRGMEAVTMSVPPTPGRSIVKRPDNSDMFGMGWVFRDKGYKNSFIYAGYGYFDNMNEYFSNNGFDIVDRVSFDNNEITFANVWGVCDEDLLNKSIKEADIAYSNSQPFFSFIMTTSNHRPYTYPDGKIDIPSHTGRQGGVKYTDYAVKEFLDKASHKPWFDNTLFVFVADHNGGSAGKQELPLHRYKIPLIVYAPKILSAQKITKLSSQIDIAPTLLGLLNWSYESRFYGQNILGDSFRPRALIGNYQKLGLYRDNKLTILLPDASVKEFTVDELKLKSSKYTEITPTKEDRDSVIGYYQSASYIYAHSLNKN